MPPARVRSAFHCLLSTLHSLRPGRLVPPKRLQFVGDGDFEKVGASFLRHFVELGGLRPHHRVLDVGSGVGRMAAPLARFLNERGSYEGFDIVPAGVEWCVRHITRRYPRFRFHLADVHNEFYHPEGRQRASEYRFPFPEGEFDFVFATSVFTHMLPDDMHNYLSQIVRVLRSDCLCLITFFLLNDESRALLAGGKGTVSFPHEREGCRIADPERPEALVAYEEADIRGAYRERGLTIMEPIHYGSWCGRERYASFQDMVIARKRPAEG